MRKVHESAEDYLEAVLRIQQAKGSVHAIDVARELDVSKPSVSVAVRNLGAKGYLQVDGERHLRLTEKGDALARKILHRHTVLSAFLQKIGVGAENAAKDACKMEHDLSEESFSRIEDFLKS